MRRLLEGSLKLLGSRAVPPCVIGLFLLIYVVIAFQSSEALLALLDLTRRTSLLVLLLALIPLNRLLRIWIETSAFWKRRRAMAGRGGHALSPLFDEEVRLHEQTPSEDDERRLAGLGYRTRRWQDGISAWRGATVFPARLCFLIASFALFAGILLSVTTRSSHREPVVEGELFPGGATDVVERIVLNEERGLLLARSLAIDVASREGGKKTFRLYPPSVYQGSFVYPRYLGFAPLVRFAAPDLPTPFEGNFILLLYPAGKEDTASIPGTPYRIVMSIAPQPGPDPFVSGRMLLNFRVLKGEELVFSGSAPMGGESARDGYRVAFPSFSRLVATDFVQDQGVLLIWISALLFPLSLLLWLPVRLWFPRREMLFLQTGGSVFAYSRAEGSRRAHAGSYHEMLDLMLPVAGRELAGN